MLSYKIKFQVKESAGFSLLFFFGSRVDFDSRSDSSFVKLCVDLGLACLSVLDHTNVILGILRTFHHSFVVAVGETCLRGVEILYQLFTDIITKLFFNLEEKTMKKSFVFQKNKAMSSQAQ